MLEHPFEQHLSTRESLISCGSLHSPALLRVLSGNFHAANQTRHYFDYVWRSWQHAHGIRKQAVMTQMAHALRPFDIVGLQETDADTFRSGRLHQTAYLAEHGDCPHWLHQPNRLMGQWASSGNGLLSKHRLTPHASVKLPGKQWFGGRGVISALLDWQGHSVIIGVTHLGLTATQQSHQLDFLQSLYQDHEHVVLMGDFNTTLRANHFQQFIKEGAWTTGPESVNTYPAWNPKKDLDHILVRGFNFHSYQSQVWGQSDHRAVIADLQLLNL